MNIGHEITSLFLHEYASAKKSLKVAISTIKPLYVSPTVRFVVARNVSRKALFFTTPERGIPHSLSSSFDIVIRQLLFWHQLAKSFKSLSMENYSRKQYSKPCRKWADCLL